MQVPFDKIFGAPNPFGIVLSNAKFHQTLKQTQGLSGIYLKLANSITIPGTRNSVYVYTLAEMIKSLQLDQKNGIFEKLVAKHMQLIDYFEQKLKEAHKED